MANPFYYGNEVDGDDFCNRVEELAELKKDVLSGLNVLLYAPRRFGKTSLLKKLKNDIEGDGIRVVYFDFFSVSSVEEFIQKYFDATAKILESNTDKIINLLKNILKIRPSISIKANQNGEISYGVSFAKAETNDVLEEALNLPLIYSKHSSKKVVVIFDEFQEIEQFELEKKFRSVIQTHGKNVSYIFCGSKKSIMNAMFSDKNRAFYKSVKRVAINEISFESWSDFASLKFKNSNKIVSKAQLRRIFELTSGFPYYMQQLLFAVWDMCEKEVADEMVDAALRLTLEREYDLYSFIWGSLTLNQKKAVKYIIQNGGQNLYSNDAMEKGGFAATTLKSAIESLIKKDICDKTKDTVYLVDPFMTEWVKRV